MLSFESDYTEGAHPNILRQLMATNMDQEPGYGFDEFSQLAKERIQKALGHPEAQIEFLTGGNPDQSSCYWSNADTVPRSHRSHWT